MIPRARPSADFLAKRGGLFLSAEGLARVRTAYEALRGRGDSKVLLTAQAILGAEAWRSFDDLYLAIYVGRLHTWKAATFIQPQLAKAGLKLARRLYVLLDIDVPTFVHSGSFEETLLSEFVVADLMQLRAAIQFMVPYPVRLERFSVGCIELEFGVWGPHDADPSDELPGLEESELRDLSTWQDLSRRFNVVEHIQLRPA